MTKQNNELARRAKPARAELILSPAMQAQTLVDRATLEEMVARQVAEMLTKSDTAIFEPFFRSRQVRYALRRLQSIPEQRVHAVRYEQGCMVARDQTGRTVGLVCAIAAIPASSRFGLESLKS